MKKIAVVYSYNSVKSAKIAAKVAENLTSFEVVQLNAEDCQARELLQYDGLVLSVPTWFDGELPNYWDEMVPALEKLDFSDHKIALFGLGDQKNYPENFCDAVGILGDLVAGRGATIIGYTTAEGYTFESSKALKGHHFAGLLLDQENQAKYSDDRIRHWVSQITAEFQA